MKPTSPHLAFAPAFMVGLLWIGPIPARAQGPGAPPPAQPAAPHEQTPQERAAVVVKSLKESQARLHDYEWIETKVLSLKGEEKSRTQSRCYYGEEGTLQRVPLAPPPEEKPARGLRGKIREQKKEKIAASLEAAGELLDKYIPPDPEKLLKVRDAGNVTIHVLEPGKRARLDFRDYLKPGDTLSIEIDPGANTVLGLGVASWLEEPKDKVDLKVTFDKLPDGTVHTSKTELAAESQGVAVVSENSGYRKIKE